MNINNQEIEIFCKLNKLYNISYNKKKVLIADRSLPEPVLINSLASFFLNKNFHLDAEIVTDVGKKNELLKIYKSFKINKIYFTSIKYNFFNLFLSMNTFLWTFITYIKILYFGNEWFIKKFKYKDIYFGDLFYDQYAKLNFNFLENNLLSLSFIKVLLKGIYKINLIEKLIKQNNYSVVLSSTTVSTSVSAITTRLALKRGIKVICLVANHFKIFNNLEQAKRSIANITHDDLANIKKNENWERKIDLYIKKRFKGRLDEREAISAYKDKKNFPKDLLYKKLRIKKKYKRIGFFAPHSFHDTSYIQGKIVHLSLYDHFMKTIKIIKESKDTLWIVKPHPTTHLYPGGNITKDYLKTAVCENLIKCPSYLNNETIIKISDIIVTCRGTIALEAGLFGKKTILGGQATYSDLKFSHLPKNEKEYKNFLLKENLNLKLSKKEVKICKKAFFYQVFINSYVNSKIIPLDKFLEVSLDKKTLKFKKYPYHRQNKKSYKKYFNIINNNLKNKNFLNDEFSIKLDKWIKKIKIR
ncbi:hypothetical protein IDH20_02210 [Pelagibacterales bacterium SAG-MED39]|nr:hypothetical protein [Pelagibacterales bacterium SAG-MED39]